MTFTIIVLLGRIDTQELKLQLHLKFVHAYDILTTVLLYLGLLPPSLFSPVPLYFHPICIPVLLIRPKSLM